MAALLTIVGLALGFAAGALWARRVRSEAVPEPVDDAAPGPSVPATPFSVVEGHPDGVVVADERGHIVHRNAAARALQGTHVGVIVDEAIERHVAQALTSGASTEVLELYGPPREVLVVDAKPLDDGGVVVFISDISEQRRVDRVRTDFVANISHELKTPVGAMSVLAETLEDETDPDTISRVVARMMSEAQRATRTIDDLMELSRIEVGGEHEFEAIAAELVVDGAMERVTELASQQGIGLTNLASAGQLDGVVVRGERRQLVSALGNLVENAVKYSDPGGLVQVRTRVDDRHVEIMVADQGIGIPQRDLDRIFERFYRVDRARSRATGGTGLGLSIVRHVAGNHGGDVAVSSTEGEGSIFTLTLPVGGSASEPGAARVDEPRAQATGDLNDESDADKGIA